MNRLLMQAQTQRDPLSIVIGVLRAEGWSPRPDPENGGLSVDFGDKTLPCSGAAFLVPDESRFVFYAQFDRDAPVETLSQVAEYITRANFGIDIGNFELDYDEGLVRYKSSFDYEGEPLAPNLIRNAVQATLDSVRMYAAGLADVMAGTKTAVQAIAEAEAELDAA